MTTSTDAPHGGRRIALRLALLVLLVLLLAASVVWLVAEALARADDDGPSGDAGVAIEGTTRDREDVMAVSEQFALRTYTYGPDDLEDGRLTAYGDRIKELITTKFAAEFEQFLQVPELYVKEFQRSQTAKVYGTGVVELSEDRAQTLVTGAYTTRWGREQVADPPIQFRWRVDLVKVDGEWKVDDFTQVTSAPTEGQVPQP